MIDTYARFTALKGKPLTIFVAMILLGGYADYLQLEEWCDYSRPTLRKHMRVLLRYRLIKPVTESRFMVNGHSEQLELVVEKLFQVDSSSIIKESVDILSIESTTTNRCKTFTPSPEVTQYLKSKGVWDKAIDEIAETAENNLLFLKAHFEGTDTALAIHRIKEAKPAPEPEKSGRDKYVTGKYSDLIEH